MSTSGTIVHWVIDGAPGQMGYFSKWALPVPGDLVTMFPGEDAEHVVCVERRRFQQPEASTPVVWIEARRRVGG